MFNKSKTLGKNILIKYLCKELMYYFFICFAFLFVIFFVNQILLIGEELLSQRAPMKDVIAIMIYSLPSIVSQSAPYATLVGFLMCLGRLASENEVLILRASGQGYKIILIPVLFIIIMFSIRGCSGSSSYDTYEENMVKYAEKYFDINDKKEESA